MAPKSRKMKVLVVEDDDPSRHVLVFLANREGHEVMEAHNGAEGLKLFETFQPDLIFSDISMPVMNGLEMLERIREKSYDTIVIMTTAFGNAEYTLKALRLRANDYLVKPILPQDIIANLQKYSDVLATRSEERDLVELILHRQLTMKLGNQLDILGKIVNRLIEETEGRIPAADRMGIRLGLLEILRNAIEHGNLEITYDEKTAAQEGNSKGLEDLIVERLSKPQYKNRSVHIYFQMDEESCEWTITDEVSGFDWKKVPDPNDPENLLSTHGRGIMLTRLNFDNVSFLEKGNRVVLQKKIPRA